MEAYKCFMDRQTLSEVALARVLALEAPQRETRSWTRQLALAASLLVVVGVAAFSLWRGAGVGPQPPVAGLVPTPAASDEPFVDDYQGSGFIAQGPSGEVKFKLPNIHGVDYADVNGQLELAQSIATPDGSFTVELGKEDILKLFWGPAGKPQEENPKLDCGDFPIMLMNWAGYEITGSVIYDGQGDLWQLTVHGEKGEDSFTLRAAPGHIPPTCCVESGAVTTTVIDTQVQGWYRSYDRDGDGVVEHVCTSEFIAHDVGIRFENTGSGGMRAGTDEATDLGGAMVFNQMLVTQMCHVDGGLYLDHIAHTDNIPAWRREKFENLAQAREEVAFAPYLPSAEPPDYAAYRGNKDFGGYLYYQEGDHNWLHVRWSRGYDDMEVTVWLPENPDGYPQNENVVDVSVPESYDWRLYDGPICDTVPEEYRLDFYKPMFRAEDMSLEVVQARGYERTLVGMAYHFRVLHENGVVVEYDSAATTAEYVWSLVEATL